jgi:phosphoribosylanthranilate isomerase
MAVPKIKFCGFTNTEDIQRTVSLDFNYYGFILEIANSPRSINLDKAIELVRFTKNISDKKAVAVVCNPSDSFVKQIIDSQTFDVIQFHGQEVPQVLKSLKGKIETWKVFNYGKNENNANSEPFNSSKFKEQLLSRVKNYQESLDKIVLDLPKDISSVKTPSEEIQEQITFDQDFFKKLSDLNIPLILAGKLTPENILERIKFFDFYGVDLASGVEANPGKKDYQKMVSFIKEVEKVGR